MTTRPFCPVPLDCVHLAGQYRYTEERPASMIEAWALAFQAEYDGVPLTSRKAAGFFGWTQWAARDLLARLRADIEAHPKRWGVSSHSAQSPHSRRTVAAHLARAILF